MNGKRQRGSSLVEFTFVGIPVLFVLISTFEMARGMWIYATLAHAVRDGARYAIVHGNNCAVRPHQCVVTVGTVAGRIRDAGAGLEPEQVTVTLRSVSGGSVITTIGPASLSSLLGNGTAFPAGPGSVPGNDVEVRASYPFRSAIVMYWPGSSGKEFGAVVLPASSRDKIQF